MSASVFEVCSQTAAFRRTKAACYTACFTMAPVFAFPPVLFAVLREQYGISYTLLGTLVLVNFCTQLGVDLIFTFFSKRFNVALTLRTMPLITCAGMLLYALIPVCAPQHAYAGLLVGTVVFSASAGLSEVLLSPTIAALPSDDPQGDMSRLHALYAFGVLATVVVSTLFLKWFGGTNWMYLALLFALIPVVAAVLFMTSPIPNMDADAAAQRGGTAGRRLGLALCAACIFFGSCAENTMSNWISGYMENALQMDKAVGDILGMAVFAILLGLARISYGRFGRRIFPVLLVSMAGSGVCYLVAAFSPSVPVAAFACVLTGLFSGMLWPGTLIMMEENIFPAGVAAFALMAASGDIGASFAPQLMGIVIDTVSASGFAEGLGTAWGLSAEQVGLRTGMLLSAVFPLVGVGVVLVLMRYFGVTKNIGKSQG